MKIKVHRPYFLKRNNKLFELIKSTKSYLPSRLHRKTVVEGNGKLDVGEVELELWDSHYMLKDEDTEEKWHGWCKPSCIPISIILVLIVLVVLLPLLEQKWDTEQREPKAQPQPEICNDTCRFSLVESIPEGLTFPNSSIHHQSTFEAWKDLIKIAESTIELASFYWTMRGVDVVPDPSARPGEEIFHKLMEAGTERKLKIHIAQDKKFPNKDTELLAKRGAAEVRSLNFPHLVGGGVLHTKMWLVDRKHFYIGSANFDWRALTQVKELGAVVHNCSCLAADLGKIFDAYWLLGQPDAKVPPKWPDDYSTKYNKDTPMNLTIDDTPVETYLSTSPPKLCPKGRTEDLQAIIDVISHAEKFVYIAVMDYIPLTLYTPKTRFWPEIDNALKTAAVEQGVKVRLLISWWNHSRRAEPYFLKSLADISNDYLGVSIEIKLFKVPSTSSQAQIPYARVNHNKYMVTDNAAYIGTSNWAADYFINTGGIGFITKEPLKGRLKREHSDFRLQLQEVFERDWSSEYAHPLEVNPTAR